jgi:alginate O-acetyltransferase complex protein AlgI
LLITMLLGGLWHGAAWHYLVWGGLHGVLMIVERLWAGPERRWRVLLTFQLFCLALLVFRAPSLQATGVMFARILHLPQSGALRALVALGMGPLLLIGYSQLTRLRRAWQDAAPRGAVQAVGYGCAIGLTVTALATLAAPPAEFIYFHF